MRPASSPRQFAEIDFGGGGVQGDDGAQEGKLCWMGSRVPYGGGGTTRWA